MVYSVPSREPGLYLCLPLTGRFPRPRANEFEAIQDEYTNSITATPKTIRRFSRRKSRYYWVEPSSPSTKPSLVVLEGGGSSR